MTRPARSPWLAFSVVAVGTFMATLDGNIVNVALPTIGRELGAPVARLQWIVNGYVLAITATLIFLGRLGDRLGHRALYAGAGSSCSPSGPRAADWRRGSAPSSRRASSRRSARAR